MCADAKEIDKPGVEAVGRARRELLELCCERAETETLERRAEEEKNAFVLFALLRALFERRATAPREVSMARKVESEMSIGWKEVGLVEFRHVEINFRTLPASSAFGSLACQS